jgi:hypothetical protein
VVVFVVVFVTVLLVANRLIELGYVMSGLRQVNGIL